MGEIPERTVKSWVQLSKVAELFSPMSPIRGPNYVFRGHEDASYKLDPSLHRAITNNRKKQLPGANALLAVEKYLLDQFIDLAPSYLPTNVVVAIERVVGWWPIMRHYGIPTRILDWTKSFYVAAYFAVSGQPDKDGAIYVVQLRVLKRAMDKAFNSPGEVPLNYDYYTNPNSPPIIHIYMRRKALPDRIIAQQGCFMVCRNIIGDLEEILASKIPKAADAQKVSLMKILIPSRCKPAFMRQLKAMNVTASSLFPGLDGIGRYLDETVRYL
jgi:hypothetical protein